MSEPMGDAGVMGKLLDWAWAGVLALGGFVYKAQNERIAMVNDELTTQRKNVAKLFDKLEEHGRRSEDRHREILTAVHAWLDRKVDK